MANALKPPLGNPRIYHLSGNRVSESTSIKAQEPRFGKSRTPAALQKLQISAPQMPLSGKPVVVMHFKKRLHLTHGIQIHAYQNQQRCTAHQVRN
jgi:hypothetical protein